MNTSAQNINVKKFYIFAVLIILFLASFTSEVFAKVQNGSTKEEVIAAYGEPSGVISSGDEEICTYAGGIIVLRNGIVENIDPNFEAQLEQRREEDKFDSKQKAKGLTQYMGQWVSKEEKKKITQKQQAQKPIVVISENGARVDLKELIVPGKITIVDFYADWCSPCKRIAPYLQRLANSDRDIFLRKIDVVKWGTPVIVQYNIRSIPDMRVFDRQGRMVGRPTYNLNEILSYIQQSK